MKLVIDILSYLINHTFLTSPPSISDDYFDDGDPIDDELEELDEDDEGDLLLRFLSLFLLSCDAEDDLLLLSFLWSRPSSSLL